MPLTLQSTVEGFDAAFMQAVPQLERTMRRAGLDPSDVIIVKDRGAPGALSFDLALFHYTVFADAMQFTVTEPDDARFLDTVQRRMRADGDAMAAAAMQGGLLARVRHWMMQPA